MQPPHERYGHKEEQVFLEGESFLAFFPKEHSVVDGLIYSVRDRNPYKGTNGAFEWLETKCYVLPKGTTLWQKVFDGSSCDFKIGDAAISPGIGLYPLLQFLEGCEFVSLDDIAREEMALEERALKNILEHAKTLKW